MIHMLLPSGNNFAKIQWLQARLTDDALQTFYEVQSLKGMSYPLIRKALHTKVYVERFNARGKKDNESFEDYAKALLILFKEAYSDDKEKERKVLHHLKPHMHYFLQSRQFKSVDEAITADCAVNTIKDAFKNDTSDDWGKWIAFFDDKCKEQCLDSSKRLVWLETRLAEKALKCYEELPVQSRKLYETAKRDFQQKIYKNSFDAKCNCRLLETKIKELTDELSKLAIGAFPDACKSCRDEILLSRILNMIKDKGIQFRLEPQTMREAVHFVLALTKIPNEFTGGKEWYNWIEEAKRFLVNAEIHTTHERMRCICSRIHGKALELTILLKDSLTMLYPFDKLSSTTPLALLLQIPMDYGSQSDLKNYLASFSSLTEEGIENLEHRKTSTHSFAKHPPKLID